MEYWIGLYLWGMKVGLYFGTFNPVHVGHMVIANHMLEFGGLDRLWFIVTPHNPLKEKTGMLPDPQRLRLVREAIGDHAKMKASDIEFHLPQPNYTINTLTYLSEKHPEHSFYLILGSDNLESFGKWKNSEQILKNYHLLVYPRPGHPGGSLTNHPRVKIVNAPLMEISSTFIRSAIKEGKDIRHYLPEAVWNYIGEMKFYNK